MAEAVTTTVTELPESRVRVEVEVPPDEVARARRGRGARGSAATCKLPGFRKGKVPAPVVIGRLGREAVLDEAVRDRLGRWYAAAIARRRGSPPVGEPEHRARRAAAASASRYASRFEIGVRPVATLARVARDRGAAARAGGRRRAGRAARSSAARERLARLEPVERAGRERRLRRDRLRRHASTASRSRAATARAQLVELGAGRPDPRLRGGPDRRERRRAAHARAALPRRLRRDRAGRPRRALRGRRVAEVREKVLPELDDDFALDAAGFDTLEELREDVRARLLEADERAVEREFRDAVLDAAARRRDADGARGAVEARAKEAWERARARALATAASARRPTCGSAGTTEEEMLAARAARRRAGAARRGGDRGDRRRRGDRADRRGAARGARARRRARRARPRARARRSCSPQLRRSGRLEELRDDVAAEQALDRLVEAAVPITPERAAAREKLWTPGSERQTLARPRAPR